MKRWAAIIMMWAGFGVCLSAAVGQAAAAMVRVPSARGSVFVVYGRLHAAGLLVSIPHELTFESFAPPTVRRVSPASGRRVSRGSTETWSVSCCRRARVPMVALRRSRHYVVPDFIGVQLSRAFRLIANRPVYVSVHLGRLNAGGASRLFDNYRITRQQPAPGTRLTLSAPKGRQHGRVELMRLTVWGVQARPLTPCAVPPGSRVIASNAQAVITTRSFEEAGTPFTGWYGCLRSVGTERLLASAAMVGGYDTSLRAVVLKGRFVALSPLFEDKYFDCSSSVDVFDLRTGAPGQVFNFDCSGDPESIDPLVLSSRGFSAWRSNSIPSPPLAFNGISCPAANLCVAVDSRGDVMTTTAPTGGPAAWSRADIAGQQVLNAVSCPSVSLCVAVQGGNVITSSDPTGGPSSWTTTSVDAAQRISAVSCPSTSLCVATDSSGNVVTSTDPTGGAAAWTVSHADTSIGGALTAISCPSATLCVAADGSGDVVASTDPTAGASAWTTSHIDADYDGLTAITCPSSSLCVAGDGEGNIVTSTDPTGGASAWTLNRVEPGTPADSVNGVSCPTTTLCLAVDSQGNVLTSTDPAGSAPTWNPRRVDTVTAFGQATSLAGLSCPSVSLCVASDSEGQVLTSSHPTGGPSAWSTALIDSSTPCTAAPCEVEALYAHDDHGTRLIDTSSPGNGNAITNVTISGSILSWQHAGAARQVSLG